jgi:hypothetical protein
VKPQALIAPALAALAAFAAPLLAPSGVGAVKAEASVSPPHYIRITDDAGAGGYEAFPDVARLRNGDLLCVFYAGYGHVSSPNAALPKGGRVCWIRSRDNGKRWTAPKTLVDTDLDDRDPSVMQTHDGTLLCNFFTYIPRREGRAEQCEICIVRSHDNGETWEATPQRIAAPPGITWACSSPILELPQRELVLPLYFMQPGKPSKSGLVRSSDSGKTWGDFTVIDPDSDHEHDSEPHIIRLPDGRLFTTLRPCMCQSYSSDNGRTWTAPTRTGFEGHAPYHLVTRDGLLLCAHRLPGTALHISTDRGATWKGPFVIDDVGGAYPSMVELPDGVVFCVYYEEGEGSSIRATWLRPRADGIEFVRP